MRRFLLLPVLLATAVPATAQTALTAEEELQCGLLFAAIGGQAKDESAKAGFGFILSYFLGRYEGRTGKSFEQGATPEVAIKAMVSASTLGPRCQAAAQSMAERAKTMGKVMQEQGRKLQGEGK